MSAEELVESYVSGSMSRRVFVRRLMAAGLSVGAAVAYADSLGTTPAAAATDHAKKVWEV
jgi:hypothetical protein